MKWLVLGLGQFFETSNINTPRRNLDNIREILSDFNSQIKRLPNKKGIVDLKQLLDIKIPKPEEILKLEIENIKQT